MGAFSVIETWAGVLPIRITVVTFLMRSKFALDVFGRDRLETGRAD